MERVGSPARCFRVARSRGAINYGCPLIGRLIKSRESVARAPRHATFATLPNIRGLDAGHVVGDRVATLSGSHKGDKSPTVGFVD